MRVLNRAFCAVGVTDALADGAHALLNERLHLRAIASCVAENCDIPGNCVVAAVRMQLRAGDDRGLQRVCAARDNHLQAGDDLRGNDHGVDGLMRL